MKHMPLCSYPIILLRIFFFVAPHFVLAQGTPCGQPFTDSRDSSVYNTVLIGNQCWMSENLRYLPVVSRPTQGNVWAPHYYVYGYNGIVVSDAKNHANYPVFGVLYNWYAAIDGDSSNGSWLNPSGVQGACPAGWHLPITLEWSDLVAQTGGSLNAGIALKQEGTTHWMFSTGATNASGFTGLPGGRRTVGGSSQVGIFTEKSYLAYFWTSSQNNGINRSLQYKMNHLDNIVGSDYSIWQEGYSLRCVQDAGSITGSADKVLHPTLTGYPNPAQSVFTFNVSEEMMGMPFQVINALGQVVLNGSIAQLQTTLSMDAFSTGIYLLRIDGLMFTLIKE